VTANSTLRAIRLGLALSQEEFARAIRDAGERLGRPNDASKRLIQRWESGQTAAPRPVYTTALEAVTGLPAAMLGFAAPDGRDLTPTSCGNAASGGEAPAPAAQPIGTFSGIWLSRYEYYSSAREHSYLEQHHVVLLQHGTTLTVRSLPGSAPSTLNMYLNLEGSVATGTWIELTNPDGPYRGARYHGAVQLLIEPTGRRMAGKWVGFGQQLEVNTGPWELLWLDGSTRRTALDAYNHPPE
jgi:transcriptional regulator with XRE-family HTH domain